MSNLRVLGCATYVYVPEETCANKLAAKAKIMCFIGYCASMKGYMFMTENNMIRFAVTAVFDEALFPCCPITLHLDLIPQLMSPLVPLTHQTTMMNTILGDITQAMTTPTSV